VAENMPETPLALARRNLVYLGSLG
jgi:hypothetical protein